MQAEMLDSIVSNSLQLFADKGFKVRVIMRCAEPWFVAKDVATCIEHSNVTKMCELCRDKDKVTITDSKEIGVINESLITQQTFSKNTPNVVLISESGLYRILAKCNLPKCEPFESWVFDEVLPSIRKTGSYSVAQTTLAIPKTLPEALRAYADEVERREAAEKRAITAEVERDEAIRTKAQIGSNREATAMNTASQKSKECKRLETENDLLTTENSRLRQDYVENKDFCKQLLAQKLVVYVEKTLRDKCSKALQELSALMEIRRLEWNEWNDKAGREVPRYAYHKDVCAELKQRIIDNPNYLKRFK